VPTRQLVLEVDVGRKPERHPDAPQRAGNRTLTNRQAVDLRPRRTALFGIRPFTRE
jgi:hypothetical protein